MPEQSKIVLAFSGGLDTSFCVPWLVDQGYDVTTLFVDTGGVDDAERDYIAKRSEALGASDHVVGRSRCCVGRGRRATGEGRAVVPGSVPAALLGSLRHSTQGP